MPFKVMFGPKQLHINHSTKATSSNKCNVTDGLHVLYKLTSYFNNQNNNRQHKTVYLNYKVIYYNLEGTTIEHDKHCFN